MILTNEEAKRLDQPEVLEESKVTPTPELVKPPKKKKEDLFADYDLSFENLTGADMPAITEIRTALTYTDFLDYFESLGEGYEKRLGLFFRKVILHNKRDKKIGSVDLSIFKMHGMLSHETIEWAFYKVQEERASSFKVEGDFNYKRLLQLKEKSVYLKGDLAMKTYLAVNFPQEVMAMSFLLSADFSNTGYLFKVLPELKGQLSQISEQFKKEPNSKTAIKKRMDLFFGDDVWEFLEKEGLV